MDAVFPLKSKKSIKAFNQAVSHNNAIMHLQIQNALYKQELNRVKAANDLANATLALAQQQAREAHEARVSTAAALAQQQAREAHEARFSAAAALAQRQSHEAAAALAQRQSHEAAAALAQHHAHEARVSTAAVAALAQQQAHEARVSTAAAAALAQQQACQAAVAATNTNKQELIATRNNKKSSKFGKLLSKMNKQH